MNWFLVRGGKEKGPYSSQQLKQAASTGQLKPDDFVRREDSTSVISAKSIQGLFSKSPSPSPSPKPTGASPLPLPPPTAPPVPPATIPAPITSAPAAKSNVLLKIALLIGGIGAALVFVCCGGLVVIGVVTQQSITAKVREADAKWFAGDKAAAVAEYRALAANHPVSLGDRLPIIYGRIIDFQFESGDVELGKKVIAEARSKSVVPTVESELAKQAMKEIPVVTVTKTDKAAGSTSKEPPTKITLANGRVPISTYIDVMKSAQDLKLHTPETGNDIAGTSFEFLSEVFGEECRVHIGGRESSGQNVSAILIESGDNRQLVGAVLATPFDPAKPIGRGNDVSSLSYFVKETLPEANLRKMLTEQGAKIALGGNAMETHGKATVTMRYNKNANELTVQITIED